MRRTTRIPAVSSSSTSPFRGPSARVLSDPRGAEKILAMRPAVLAGGTAVAGWSSFSGRPGDGRRFQGGGGRSDVTLLTDASSRGTVLVVEDDPDSLEMLRRMLEALGVR